MSEKSYSELPYSDNSGLLKYRLLAAAANAPINWTTWRRRAFALLHLTSLAFAVIGIYTSLGLKNGKLIHTPVYSKYDIAQAGYNRNLVTPPLPGTLSDSHPSSNSVAEDDRIPENRQGTFLDTWTFSNNSSLCSPIVSDSKSSDQHLLILSPIRNAHSILPTYFRHLENLQHPKSNTSIGFLLSDEEDETGILVQHWCDEQAAKGEYRHVTLLRKDFGFLTPKGEARHQNWVQAQRRGIMARARTLLLMSAINPTVDWVFWLDVDVAEMPSSIIQDLMHYGQIDASTDSRPARQTVVADIITPNIMYKHKGVDVRGYDLSECPDSSMSSIRNEYSSDTNPYLPTDNWAETPRSLRLKETLDPDIILHEGDKNLPTHRMHLAREWVKPNVTIDPFVSNMPSEGDSRAETSNLYDSRSEAYIGRQLPLDAVGGVATLVRASVHLFGGVFPSWNVDHAVETEGFGVLAKLVGARTIGLPNYLVIHR